MKRTYPLQKVTPDLLDMWEINLQPIKADRSINGPDTMIGYSLAQFTLTNFFGPNWCEMHTHLRCTPNGGELQNNFYSQSWKTKSAKNSFLCTHPKNLEELGKHQPRLSKVCHFAFLL